MKTLKFGTRYLRKCVRKECLSQPYIVRESVTSMFKMNNSIAAK